MIDEKWCMLWIGPLRWILLSSYLLYYLSLWVLAAMLEVGWRCSSMAQCRCQLFEFTISCFLTLCRELITFSYVLFSIVFTLIFDGLKFKETMAMLEKIDQRHSSEMKNKNEYKREKSRIKRSSMNHRQSYEEEKNQLTHQIHICNKWININILNLSDIFLQYMFHEKTKKQQLLS